MDNKNIPYFVHEGEMVRMERVVKRLWITIILLIVLLVGTNGAWLWWESQFQYFTVTQEAESDDGSDIIMNGTGELEINGTWKTDGDR